MVTQSNRYLTCWDIISSIGAFMEIIFSMNLNDAVTVDHQATVQTVVDRAMSIVAFAYQKFRACR